MCDNKLEVRMMSIIQKRRLGFGIFVILIAIVIAFNGTVYAATPNMDWKNIDIAKSYNYRGIAQNDKGLFIVVGDEGIVKTSNDLDKWETQNSGTKSYLFGCAWGNGKFVAVGESGTIIYSEDGIKWSKATANNKLHFDGVVWGSGKFIAVGIEGNGNGSNKDKLIILSSSDGVNWTNSYENMGSFSWNNIVFINGLFVVMGYDDYAFSQDGLNWTVKAMPTEDISFNDMIWDGKQYIAIGNKSTIYVSSDVTTWTPVVANINKDLFLLKIVQFDNKYVLVIEDKSSCVILSSSDLRTWSLASNSYYSEISEFIKVNDKLIAAGWYETILQTKDCTAWNVINRFSPSLLKVVWNGKQFLSVGNDGSVFISKNGSDWSTSIIDSKDPVVDVVWTGTNYAAISVTSDTEPNSYDILKSDVYTSMDGVRWTHSSSIDQKNMERIFYFDSRYFILGRKGEIISSSDAIHWTVANTNTDKWLRGLAWNGKSFVCVGMFGVILRSSDGVNWTKQDSKCECDFNSVVWNGRTFVAAGAWKTISSSGDGVKWNTVIGYVDCTFEDVVWDGEKFIFIQNIGNIYSTKNLKSLTLEPANALSSPKSIAWSGMSYVMVGRNGSMAVCTPVNPIKVKINGAPVLLNEAPQYNKDKIVIPAKEIAEKLGASFSFNDKAKSAKIVKGKTSIVLTTGSKTANVNGKAVILDVPASMVNGTVMVSAKFIVEKLGAKYTWDSITKTISIAM
jgi:Predicted kinase related to dihydroxyacetone kinase